MQQRMTRYCDYDLCADTFDPHHSNADHFEETVPKPSKSKVPLREWTVRARCVVLKELIVRGTQEQAEALTGEIVKEQELDQLSATVLSCQPAD